MIRILFVCLGNICRSPMAEGIFQRMIEEENLTDYIEIESAGTGGWHVGELPDARMRQTATQHGITLVTRARQVSSRDFFEFDYIIPMDSSNQRDLIALLAGVNDPKATIIKMRHFDPLDKEGDVPDPYYGGIKGFEHVYDILKRSNKDFLAYLKEKYLLN